MEGLAPFGTLDFLYMPSRDVAADARHFVDVLGGTSVFAIDDGGTRVAMVALGAEPPSVLLTDHLNTDAPILVYRVDDLASQADRLTASGVEGWRLELPMGPAFSFTAPGGQRFALYEPTRPSVVEHFTGRHDF
jgi:hypothetical protein